MMDLWKVKQALEKARWYAVSAELDDLCKEALAEIEKPAEDLKALVYDIAIDCACIQKPKDYDVYERSAINKIQQYAESYHAEQCKACKAITVTDNRVCRTCGNYTMCDTPFYRCVGKYWQPLPEAPK